MILDQITAFAQATTQRVGSSVAFSAVVGVLGLTAYGFATGAVFIALLEPLGAAGACAIVSVICAVAAYAVFAHQRSGRSSTRLHAMQTPPSPPPSDRDAINQLIATFMAAAQVGRSTGGRDPRK